MTRHSRLRVLRSLPRSVAITAPIAISMLAVGMADGATADGLPSDSGRIAFTENTLAGGFDIVTVRPDGSGRRRLTFNNDSYTAAYGPEGRRIAYTKCGGNPFSCSVWLMRADGGNKKALIPGPSSDPAWSPDGTEIVYVGGDDEVGPQLFVYTLATGVSRQLTSGSTGPGPRASQPTWSPSGRRIAFIRFFVREKAEGDLVAADNGALSVIRADGTELEQVAPAGRLAKASPDWSPNSDRIAFARILVGGERTPNEAKGISTIRSDGTGVRRLSRRTDLDPTWSPSGTRLAFSRVPSEAPGDEHPGVWTMGELGGRLQQVYPNFSARDPDWQPRP